MTYTITKTSRRYPALKSLAVQAREIMVAGALPDSLRDACLGMRGAFNGAGKLT